MADFRVYGNSREPLPSRATVDGQPVPHKVAIVPFETGDEREPAADADVWVDAPMQIVGVARGYYHIFTLVTQGESKVISHSPQHLLVL